jgi:hypothetical protein
MPAAPRNGHEAAVGGRNEPPPSRIGRHGGRIRPSRQRWLGVGVAGGIDRRDLVGSRVGHDEPLAGGVERHPAEIIDPELGGRDGTQRNGPAGGLGPRR